MKRYIGIVIFVTLFISSVSLIAILIARGYNFTEREIKENGIVEIKANLEDVTIIINDKEEGKTPKKIELEQGVYRVRLEKDQYITWEKDVELEAGIVTDIEANLFPEKKELDQLTFGSIEKSFFSEDGNIALYTTIKKPNRGIWLTKLEKSIFEISTEKPQKIADIGVIPEEAQDSQAYSISIATDNKRALLTANTKASREFYILDLSTINNELVPINTQIGYNPTAVSFGERSETLIVSDAETLSYFNTSNSNLQLIARTKEILTPSVTSFGNEYLLLDQNLETNQPAVYELDGNLRRTEYDLSEDIDLKTITTISGNTTTRDFFALATKKGSYIYNTQNKNNPLKQLTKDPVTFVSWAADGLSVLFVHNSSLKSAVITRLPDNKLKVQVHTVVESYKSESIVAKWAPNSEQLVIHNTKTGLIYSVDKDGKNPVNLFEQQIADASAFIMSKSNTFLVVLLADEKNTSNLYTVKLRI